MTRASGPREQLLRRGRTGRWSMALLLIVASCGQQAKPSTPSPETGPAQTVQTASVSRSAQGEVFRAPAVVRARERAALSSRAAASVVALPFREGDRVKAGEVLVRLDDAALRSGVEAAHAALTTAEADLQRMQALQTKGAATAREVEEATARKALAQASWSGARDNLTYGVLRAPFAGRISSRPVNVGDVAAPGRILIELEGEGGLEVHATLAAEVVASIRPGNQYPAHVDGLNEPLLAVVSSVSPAGDLATHRFDVRADLPANPSLRSGLFARLLLPVTKQEPRLLIPTEALFRRGGLTGVFVVRDGKAWLRWVAPGEDTGDQSEVRAGLSEGEKVVLRPGDLLDGTPVKE